MEFEGLNPEIQKEIIKNNKQSTIIVEGNTIKELNESLYNFLMLPYDKQILSDNACLDKYGINNHDRYNELFNEINSREYLNKGINESVSTEFETDYVNRVHNISFIDRLNDLPYFTPMDMSELGVYSKADSNYYGEPSNIEYNDLDWYKDYQLLSLGVLPENYKQSSLRRSEKLESLYRDLRENGTNNSIKQSILELGWNPEIEYYNDNRSRVTNNTREKLRDMLPKWDIYDATKISDSPIRESEGENKNPIYIILVYTGSSFGKMIKAYTKGIYTHAALATSHLLNRLYSYNLANNYSKLGGFSIESIEGYIRDNANAIMCVYTTFIDDIRYKKLIKQLEGFKNNVDKTKYSILNVFTLLANTPVELNNDMICSQFVDRMLKTIDIDITGKKSSLVTPNDLYKAGDGKLFKIYEGRVDKYDDNKAKNIVNKLKRSYISEAKSTSIQFDADGNLLIIKDITDIREEFNKSHKLLMNYDKTNNYEAMKYELYKLWYMNLILERKIYTKRNPKKEYLDMRANILNDFNKYLKKVNVNDPNYIFSDGYEQSQYNDSIYKIHNNTLKYGVKYTKRIVGLFEESDYNPLLNKYDLEDHHAIGVAIFKNNKILVMYHNKFDILTIPVGKAKYNQSPIEGAIEEVKEETNININEEDLIEIDCFELNEIRNGIKVRTINHLYIAKEWSGKVKNMEPNKHKYIKWMAIDEIKNSTIEKGYMTTHLFDYLDRL